MGTHSEKKPRSRRGRATKSETYRSNESGYQLNFGLERWRSQGKGPVFVRLPGRVLYRLEDVEMATVSISFANFSQARNASIPSYKTNWR